MPTQPESATPQSQTPPTPPNPAKRPQPCHPVYPEERREGSEGPRLDPSSPTATETRPGTDPRRTRNLIPVGAGLARPDSLSAHPDSQPAQAPHPTPPNPLLRPAPQPKPAIPTPSTAAPTIASSSTATLLASRLRD